jgi:hypothetical protein
MDSERRRGLGFGFIILSPIIITGNIIDSYKRDGEEILASKIVSEYCEKCFGITKEKRKEIINNINKNPSYKNRFMNRHCPLCQ